MAEIRRGRVSTFDEDAGLGTIESASGEIFALHCTAIADGSRTIAVGTQVSYVLTPAHLGRWEPRSVTPSDPAEA